jgi:hypothetical protein
VPVTKYLPKKYVMATRHADGQPYNAHPATRERLKTIALSDPQTHDSCPGLETCKAHPSFPATSASSAAPKQARSMLPISRWTKATSPTQCAIVRNVDKGGQVNLPEEAGNLTRDLPFL